MLHAALGQPSPQPFLWVNRPWHYWDWTPAGEKSDPERLCEALRRNGVRTIVLAYRDALEYEAPPCLRSWVKTDFIQDRAALPLAVYKRAP